MTCDAACNTAIEGILQGVASGVVWVLLATGITYVRDHYVRRKLRKAFSYIGTVRSEYGFGVSIHNKSAYPVVIKDVTLFDDKNVGVQLLFAWQDLSLTVSEARFRDKRKFVVRYARKESTTKPEWKLTAIPLEPNSQGTWLAPDAIFRKWTDFKPVRCHIAVQYQNLLGMPKLIVVDTNSTEIETQFAQFACEKSLRAINNVTLELDEPFTITESKLSFNQDAPI